MRHSIAVCALLAAALPAGAQDLPVEDNWEPLFLSRVRQLTFDGRRAGEGYFSPDGRQLVFQSERDPANPFYQIYRLDLESGDVSLVSTGSGKTTCAFFLGSGPQVLFGSTHLDVQSADLQKAELEFRASGKERRYSWDYDENYDIFLTTAKPGEFVRLTNARGYDAEASSSPDGKLIVFSSMRDAYRDDLTDDEKKLKETNISYFGEIYTMNADGTNQRRLTQAPGYDGGPFFSADGAKIIFRRFDREGAIADIWTMNTDGTDQRQLTDFKCMAWAPYFHSNGQYAIFTTNKLGFANFELYMVDAAGEKEPVRVTYNTSHDVLPVFSPDGAGLCWTATRHGKKEGQLYMAKWNHEAALKALAEAPKRAKETKE